MMEVKLGCRSSLIYEFYPSPTDHAKLCQLLDKYEKAFLVGADNVGSKQFMDIRKVGTSESFIKNSATSPPHGPYLDGSLVNLFPCRVCAPAPSS